MINIQDFNKSFPNNKACLLWLFSERFGTPACPKCKRVNKYYRQGESSHFVCLCGGHQLSPKKDTIFEKSDTDLYKWFYALYLFSVSKNGVSSKELQRQLKVTYKTAWRIGNQIRKLFAEHRMNLSGVVEADETFIGGYLKGGHGGKEKTPVIGVVQRGGSVKAKVVSARETHIVLKNIKDNVARGTQIMSDQFGVYRKTKLMGYKHEAVNHWAKEYARGPVHTNTIEGFWSQLKRSIDGTYHVVSRKHLQSYVNEFSFRYNRRKGEIFEPLMARAGRRV